MIRVSDYIANTLAEHGVRHVFMVTGGGAMHLNDAFGRCPGLEYVCCHHEQACAMAAESYCRLTNRLAALNVTTGPGGINALNGVFGAWTDSIGMIVISGQVRYETVVASTGLPLRQLGDQEAGIVKMVESIAKYAVMVTDPKTIRYHLEKALYLAQSGRPGPVWLDIPMNVQGALIEPDDLAAFGRDEVPDNTLDDAQLKVVCEEIRSRCLAAQRPVLMAGSGVRIAGAQAQLLRLAAGWGVPLVTAWNAHDLVPNEHPCYAGRPGTIGDRAGNFAVQNADFLLVLGSRLNIRQISYNWPSFAREAYQVVVDIDEIELRKPTIRPDLPVHADVARVLEHLLAQPARDR
ncbi:MAG TPA: thiamine pyrophosphate-binding protein, partial [Pirellulales bacterium]|nr:thiamine pyrophosphate-binding protein [Pirellulales bacterium]